jgi:uncharacterized surface protein with fasciclin (FAS1) repeats
MPRKWMAGVVAAVAALALGSGAMAADVVRPAAAPLTDQQAATKDIVDTAVDAGQFTTLAKALQAADLVTTLKGAGPFTVFAPTDAAFAKLPAATLDSLLANPAELRKVLTYHVVAGRVTAADVVKLTEATTVNGAKVQIAVRDGKVVLNGTSTVATADVMASNGVIHVIDTVILPPAAAATPAATPAAAAPAPAKTGTMGPVGAGTGMTWLLASAAALTLLGVARLATARARR